MLVCILFHVDSDFLPFKKCDISNSEQNNKLFLFTHNYVYVWFSLFDHTCIYMDGLGGGGEGGIQRLVSSQSWSRPHKRGKRGWSVMNDLQTKKESLDWCLLIVNSPVVGDAPGYGFYRLPGPSRECTSPDGWAVWSVVVFTRWWLLVDHYVLRNWDRMVRAVKGLISRAGMVSICPITVTKTR